jgi:addiction module RelE/StbE family toxin
LKLDITGPARADIEHAVNYIAEDSPQAAQMIADRILSALESLATLPDRGRPGRVTGTREFVIARTSYIAIYRTDGRTVVVTRVLHGHQDWPPR